MNLFLQYRPIPEKYRVPKEETPFGYIYCIEYVRSCRKYIGSTYAKWVGVENPKPLHSLRKRASQYLYEYNKYKDCSPSVLQTLRPVVQAMVQLGFENFVMYPLAETTKQNHLTAENYFIYLYDTIDNGYNVNEAFLTAA